MRQIFKTARETCSHHAGPLSETWNKLGAKNLVKAGALACATFLFIQLTGLVGGSGAPFIAPLAMLGCTAVSAEFFGRSLDRLKRDTREILWKNDAGQTVKSTIGQKANLEGGQARIYRALDRGAYGTAPEQKIALWKAQKLTVRFGQVAARASVVADLTPPAGKFIFSRRGPALRLEE